MSASAESIRRRWTTGVLGHDSPRTFVGVVALFVVYTIVEHTTSALVRLGVDDLARSSLVIASIGHRLPVVALVVLAVVAVALLSRSTRTRFVCRWEALQQGRTLRWLAATLIVPLAWQGSLYEFNWLAGRVHLIDRGLLVVLAVAAVLRPAALLPFVVVVRIVAEQFLLPFGTSAGRNIDRLLVLALVAIAAVHLTYVITGNTRTAPVLLVITAALAAHFFVPGKGKLGMGWLTSGDASNLPLSSYTTGWLGHTDGGWARDLSSWYRRLSLPLRIGTLLLEIGAIVAVMHPRLTRLWLPVAVGFHVLVFATTGFWFAPWIVLEVGLLVILSRTHLRSWVAENATPARGALAAMAVLGASVLFSPPGLAWLDAPTSYGYEIEGIGDSGTSYHVALSVLAPLDQHLAFTRVQFSDFVPASGAYGAVTSAAEFDALSAIADFDDLDRYEHALAATTLNGPSTAFMQTFLDRTADRPSFDWSVLSAPDHFWTSRPAPEYEFQEPLAELEVAVVRSIHHDGRPEYRRDVVLRLTRTAEPPGG